MGKTEDFYEYYVATLNPICKNVDIRNIILFHPRHGFTMDCLTEYCPHWNVISTFGGYKADSLENIAEIQKMFHFCEDNSVDLIVCSSISRLSRNIATAVEIIQKFHCLQNKIGFYFADNNLYSLDYEADDGQSLLANMIISSEHQFRSEAARRGWVTRKKNSEYKNQL